jgi:hypothetical protein
MKVFSLSVSSGKAETLAIAKLAINKTKPEIITKDDNFLLIFLLPASSSIL